MRKNRIAARPQLEMLDRRELLSGFPPTLTTNRLNAVARGVKDVMGTLARTDDFDAAGRRLGSLAASVPYGRRDLAPAWLASLASVDRGVPGSGLAAQDQMIRDLYQVVHAQVQDRAIRVSGAGSDAFTQLPPPVVPSEQSITLVNLTGEPIKATVYLNVIRPGQRPTIGPRVLEPLPGGNTYLFDFGTKAPAWRSISLKIDATKSTKKFVERPLVQPYGGTAFYVTTIGPYFDVSPWAPGTPS